MSRYIATVVEILPPLFARYGGFIRSEIIGVRIVHKKSRCYLEITSTSGDGRGEKVERIDLAFIHDDEGPTFRPEVSAFETGRLFVEEFDPYSIIHCTPLYR